MKLKQSLSITLLVILLVMFAGGRAYAQCASMSAPSLVSPANGATAVVLAPTLTLTDNIGVFDFFCDHDQSQWQVSDAPGFGGGDIVWDSGWTGANKTTISVPNATLSSLTNYFWRARIRDTQVFPFTNKTSSWTAARNFQTMGILFPPFPLGCRWGSITPTAPADNAVAVSTAPMLEVTRIVAFFPLIPGPCNHSTTQWQVSTISGPFFPLGIVYDSGDDNVNKAQITLPPGTLNSLTTYYWRAKFKAGGEEADWTPTQKFTTALILVILCFWGNIENTAPADASNVPLTTPNLQITRTPPVFPTFPCSNSETRWQTASNPAFGGGDIVHDSGFDAVNLTSYVVPPGNLLNTETYYWRAKMSNGVGSESAWTAPTEFTVQLIVLMCNWGGLANASPANGAVGVPTGPTLTVLYSPPLLFPCSHDATEWQIATDMAFASIVISTGDDAINLTSLSLPSGNLNGNTNYYWRARFKSGGGEVSDWSTATGFQTIAGGGGPLPPVANFTHAPGNPNAGQGVQFTDASTDDGSIVAWDWNYGDGDSSTSQNPTHAFAAPGTYNVSLTVTDNDGLTNTKITAVTVGAGGGGGGGLTIDQAVARLVSNDPSGNPTPDNFIGDQEIIEAIRLWILGLPVPGTDGLSISDTKMLDLISKWVLGQMIP